ncbi:4-hydroxybenzoate polyprenyltransferase [Synechococcus sp. RSCCF101]|uniref:4-hydroxybenzoate polyprenyltransferase n=1 Tax=Synechococcus sp. RSCCF101 TaxID=2511069 RepID=UPI0012453653|nr:4-hydroxybenzoate polyprenyltransferase [Synechococcus sp. RSCCF101]QEY30957.1 4-hydroxybenzoate polyprenyltransferase [Synechococcus sp. RSCCF101]
MSRTEVSAPVGPPSGLAAWLALLRWNKPTGRLILLIPAGWALWLSPLAPPAPALLLLIVAGGLAVSGAGCIANDLWDRRIDAQVSRTRSRPLASGRVRPAAAAVVMVLLLLLALAVTLALPHRALVLALAIGCLPLVLLYPSAKRWTGLPQLVLALCWGFAVLIPWAAAVGDLPLQAPLIGCWLATVLWTFGFDTVYAMPDRADDRRIGVRSSARTLGHRAPAAVSLCYGGAAVALAVAAAAAGLSAWFWPLWFLAALGMQREVRRLPLQASSGEPYGQHFRNQVRLGSLLLLALVVGRF